MTMPNYVPVPAGEPVEEEVAVYGRPDPEVIPHRLMLARWQRQYEMNRKACEDRFVSDRIPAHMPPEFWTMRLTEYEKDLLWAGDEEYVKKWREEFYREQKEELGKLSSEEGGDYLF